MKTSLRQLRSLIREVLLSEDETKHPDTSSIDVYYAKQREDAKRLGSLKFLERTNKPYLKGMWEEIPRNYGREEDKPSQYRYSRKGKCWKAEDPQLGTVFLSFDSEIYYVNVKNSRLRDPGKTKHYYVATIGFTPFSTNNGVTIFSKVAIGERRETEEKIRNQVSDKMMKLFGVDPYDYLRPISTQQPTEPVEQAPVEKQDDDVSAPVQQQSPSGSSGKTYKIYGKKGNAPAHTRFKGKAYIAGKDTKFKSGDKATISPEGDKLKVTSPDNGNTQLWDSEDT